MVSFPLRPLLLRRQPQLSLRFTSLPFACSAVAVVSVQSSPELSFSSPDHHGALRIPQSTCCSEKGGLHCSISFSQTRRPVLVVLFRGTSVVDKGSRGISTAAQTGDDALVSAGGVGSSWGARRISAGQLRIQSLVGYGYAQRSVGNDANLTLGRAGAAERKASGGHGVECVKEEEEDAPETKGNVVLWDEDVIILTQSVTPHNFVRVLEVSRSADSVLAGARVLLLDKPGNVHSIYQKYKLLTEAYYDILAAFPAVIPEGPIGIFGLGAGTAARLIHHFWPEIDMHGWELDPGVVQAARKYFDLEELEWKEDSDILEKDWDDLKSKEIKDNAKEEDAASQPPVGRRRNSGGSYGLWKDESVKLSVFHGMGAVRARGRLRVHVGDALHHPLACVEGGFAGLIVDLFAEGAVIPALQEVETWRRIRANLMPGGRIMVNCGGSCVEAAAGGKDGGITMRETVAALAEAFPGELSVASLRDQGDNSMALTGPPPDFQLWRDTLPECLRRGMDDWRPFSSS